ncbi:MAG: ABC transporter permease, partial [Planctomycetota bacterium]
ILLASPLTPLGITAGKLTSRVGQVLGWVAAALPPLVTAILFGGVAPGRILDVLLTLLAVVLELGAWGLLVSCISRRMATAAILAYGIPAARWFAFSSSWMTWGAGGGTISGTAFLLTPFPGLYGGQQVIQSGVFAAVPSLAYALFAIVLTASCLLLAARFLGREEDMQSRTTKRIRAIKGEQRLRRWITRGNPVAWKESLLLNTAGSRTLFYIVAAVLVAGEVAFLAMLLSGHWSNELERGYVAGVGMLIALFGAIAASASMTQERSQGTMELLRLTPLGAKEIAHGKALGLAVGLGWLTLGALHPLHRRLLRHARPLLGHSRQERVDGHRRSAGPWRAVHQPVLLLPVAPVVHRAEHEQGRPQAVHRCHRRPRRHHRSRLPRHLRTAGSPRRHADGRAHQFRRGDRTVPLLCRRPRLRLRPPVAQCAGATGPGDGAGVGGRRRVPQCPARRLGRGAAGGPVETQPHRRG